MARIEGILTAMVSPFYDDGSLDLPGARSLAAHLVAHGSHGVVVAGTTGESPTLTDDEKIALLEGVLEEVGDGHTVICGTGSNDTAHSARLTKRAADAGAHGVLAVTPYYNRPNERGLRAHFAAVSEAAGETAVALYNIPSRSAINMGPALLSDLAAEHDNIIAVKQANNDEMGPIEGLEILAGNDDSFARCLELGGAGGILVASHILGEAMRDLYDAASAGDSDRARELHAGLVPVYEAFGAAPPASMVKSALAERGLIGGTLRLPMVPANRSESELLRAALAEHAARSASRAA